jgi:molybdate transport system substrate-binding protein
VSVAAASDLRYALDEVVAAFTAMNPDTEVMVSYGSSGSFYAQLVNGAPFDLFLSADVDYARRLVTQGVAVADSLFIYAEGRLVVWVPAASGLDIEARGLDALRSPAITRVAIANPEHAPYGRAAEAALRSAGVYDVVKPKLVLGDNVSQALQFVESGAAEAGVVALSLALAPPVVAAGRYVLVPATAHPRLEQGGVIMAAAAGEGASRLRSFLMSPDGRAVLDRYGFVEPR